MNFSKPAIITRVNVFTDSAQARHFNTAKCEIETDTSRNVVFSTMNTEEVRKKLVIERIH